MKILVLGDSDTSSSGPGAPSWTRIAADRLAAKMRTPVDLVETTLLPVGERAPRVARARVEEQQPEVVILPVGSWVFTSGFVWLRVRRLFGERAGRWFRGVEMGFDNATRSGGRVKKRANRALRWLARRLIGTEPFATMEATTQAIEAILDQLSQREDVQVVVVGYPGATTLSKPAAAAERRIFVANVRAAAERRRFPCLDAASEFNRAGVPISAPDGLHMSRAGHEFLGELVAETLIQGRA